MNLSLKTVIGGVVAPVALAALIAAAGCAVGPDYVRPADVPVPGGYVADHAADSVVGDDPAYGWWRDFGSARLDSLVEEAFAASPDLMAAAGRVTEARAQLKAAGSNSLPSVEIGGSASRSKLTMARFGGRGSIYSTLYDASANASWELDLWGRLSRTRRAGWADLMAVEANRIAVRQGLAADVVRAWLMVSEAEGQRDLSVRTEESWASSLDMVEDRYAGGVSASLDVHQSRQALASARARRVQWEEDLAVARRALEILVGRYPAGRIAAEGEALAQLPELKPVPAGLPANLLGRRPDVVAAEMSLRAAGERIGAAKADLFPRLSLTGNAGYSSPELDDLITDGASVWSLVGNLTMPLLNRGARTAQVDAAEGRAEQARAAYAGVLLNGFRDVEAALTAGRLQDIRRGFLRESVGHAERSLDVARDRYRQGLDPYLTVLDARRQLHLAESELLRAEGLVRRVRVDLIQALGGPWDVRPDQDSAAGTRTDVADAPRN